MTNLTITTPIFYPSGAPHLGHFYTSVACDVWARWQRMQGHNVLFSTGTDEHGLKIQRKAEAANITPQAYVDDMVQQFRALESIGNLSNDAFIRTTDAAHKKAAQALWQTLSENDHIYKDTYSGWYCVSDEAYFDEGELTERDGQKFAPSGHAVEWMTEESYFFKLSAFQDKLLNWYDQNPTAIAPESRRNEVMSFVKSGLRDLSISRSQFSWGVPVPQDDAHVMYVWIDALTNYLTVNGYPETRTHWEGMDATDTADVLHVVGKDILRFHAVYWPAFLMAANLPLPRQIFAHGWWLSEGKKMSKSFNNVIAPEVLTAEYGTDPVRFFLLRECSFGDDGNFQHDRFIGRLNTELANDLGNLFQRTLAMVNKNFEAKVPALGALLESDQALFALCHETTEKVSGALENLAFHEALEAVWMLIRAANKYMDDKAPWQLRKESEVRAAHVLRVLMETQAVIGYLLLPFMPTKAAELLAQLGLSETFTLKPEINLQESAPLPKPEGVFPRIEKTDESTT